MSIEYKRTADPNIFQKIETTLIGKDDLMATISGFLSIIENLPVAVPIPIGAEPRVSAAITYWNRENVDSIDRISITKELDDYQRLLTTLNRLPPYSPGDVEK